MIDPDTLKRAERSYRTASRRAEVMRAQRNRHVWEALDAGWTHAQIAEATGLTRGRINQIARMPRDLEGFSS